MVRERIVRSVRQLTHRGPDDEGVEIVCDQSPTVVFGHRRLSVIDLSSAGHQPMCDRVPGNWITYNGEIYNFRELRADLVARGHVFVSECDTEVILKAYAQWGIGCWRRLRGIFAFGLWDAQFRELHLVRDQVGVKPLYFSKSSKGIVFASEVRAILAGDWTARKLSLDGLRSYLKYGSVQEPATLVEGVESLPPGHYLTCEADGKTTMRHFWQMTEALVRNWEHIPTADGVLNRLQESVRRQMIADVPVGVFLSGGMDSAAIAALAVRARPGAVRTFCIGTDEKESDESAEAAATAAALGCQHTTLTLEGSFVRQRLNAALSSYDQPSHDGINAYFVSALVRNAGIKVALSGLGGDELFGGYAGFNKALKVDAWGRRLQIVPAGLRDAIGRGASAITRPGDAFWGGVAEMFSPELAAPYFSSRILFSRRHGDRLLAHELRCDSTPAVWEKRQFALAQSTRGMSAVTSTSVFELQTYLVSTLLRDADQMSMAHGLELRVPLIDSDVIEHVLPISPEEKIRGGVGKRLLFDALKGIVPSEVFARPKRGFTLPFEKWLMRDLQESVGDCFHSANLSGPWDRRNFNRVWIDFSKGRVTWSRVLTLFVVEKWLQENTVSA